MFCFCTYWRILTQTLFQTVGVGRVALVLADYGACMCFRVPGYFTQDGVLCEPCSSCSDTEYAKTPCSSSADVVCETCFNEKPEHSEYIANCAWSCKTSTNPSVPGSVIARARASLSVCARARMFACASATACACAVAFHELVKF